MKYVIPILMAVLLISAIFDIRYRRIPNWLNFSAIIIGIVIHTMDAGGGGFILAFGGMLLGIGLLIIFYLAGGMGAGDVKLMGVVGAFLGPEGVFIAFLCTALVGGIYSLVVLAASRRLGETVRRYGLIIKSFIMTRQLILVPPYPGFKLPVLCYGVAIFAGSVISLFIKPI